MRTCDTRARIFDATPNPMRRRHMATATRRRRTSPGDAGRIQRSVAAAITSGETLSTGVGALVRNTLVAAVRGARDVGAEIAQVGIAAVRRSEEHTSELQ